MNALSLDTVVLSKDRAALEILDQTLLPNEIQVLRLTETEEIWEAIRSLRVRGAPAIGVCAGYAMALAASKIETDSREEFLAAFREKKAYLASSRPTAVNLFWALDRMERVAADHPELSLSEPCCAGATGSSPTATPARWPPPNTGPPPRRSTPLSRRGETICAYTATRRARFFRARGSRRSRCAPPARTPLCCATTRPPA